MRYETLTGWGRLAVIGLLALVMSACGGNGGGGTTMTTTPPPVDTDALNAAKAAAMAAYDAAKKAVTDVEDNKSADMASYDMAVAKRDEAKAANDQAQAATTVADAEKYRDAARDANTEAMKYANMVTAAAGTAADRAMAAALAPAIADPDGNGLFAGLQKDERPDLPGDTDTVTYPVATPGSTANGTEATISVGANDILGVDDMDAKMKSRPNQFQEMGGSLSNGAFSGQAYRRDHENTAYDLTVYTDMKAPGSLTYRNYYADENGTALTTRPGVLGGIFGDDSTVDNYGQLNLGHDSSTTLSSTTASLFSASWFPTGSEAERSITATATGNARMFSGTFNGISGTYSCAAGGECSAANNKDGRLSSLTGAGWRFTPADSVDITTAKIDAVDHDADYLAFGYWIKTTTNSDDATEVAVNSFATGSDPYSPVTFTLTTLSGKATYAGQAAGQYVLKTGPVGDAKPTDSGGFTGDASLTALFGGNSIAVADHLSISGSITSLRNGDGEIIDPNWTVSLGKAAMFDGDPDGATNPLAFGPAGGQTNYNTEITNANAVTTGGGSWEGGFFGPVGTTTEDYPTGVAGEFNAHFSNGHVIGAFGATKK